MVKCEQMGKEATVWKNSTQHAVARDHMPDHKMAEINRSPNKDGVQTKASK